MRKLFLSLLFFSLSTVMFCSCAEKTTNILTSSYYYAKNISDSLLLLQVDKNIISERDKLLDEKLKKDGFVNIKDSIPAIIIDLKYASEDNFIGYNFYGDFRTAYIREECYYKLKNAYLDLQKKRPGYTFIIYDALRSLEAQQLMWDSLKCEESKKHFYVADPKEGSIHNYGMSLDLTIVNDKQEILDMGTDFDFFGDLACPSKTDYFFNSGKLNENQYNNRKLLFEIMENAKLYVSSTEWWHYSACSLSYAKQKYKIFSLKNFFDDESY